MKVKRGTMLGSGRKVAPTTKYIETRSPVYFLIASLGLVSKSFPDTVH